MLFHFRGPMLFHFRGPTLFHFRGPMLFHFRGPMLFHFRGPMLFHFRGPTLFHFRTPDPPMPSAPSAVGCHSFSGKTHVGGILNLLPAKVPIGHFRWNFWNNPLPMVAPQIGSGMRSSQIKHSLQSVHFQLCALDLISNATCSGAM